MSDNPEPASEVPRGLDPTARLRLLAARVLLGLGLLTLPAAAGAVLGFYAADQGLRWLPGMLEIVLVACGLALLLIFVGQWLEGRVVVATASGRRLRKRFATILALAALAAGVRLVVFHKLKPEGLTALSVGDFNRAHQIDSGRYREITASMDRLLERLESELGDQLAGGGVLGSDAERTLLEIWRSFHDLGFTLDAVRVYWEDWWRFDPSRAQRSQHVRSYLLTYAAELALYERGVRFIDPVLDNPNAVKFLDAPHPQVGLGSGTFSRFRQEVTGTRDGARVIAGERYLDFLEHGLNVRDEVAGWGSEWLWQRCRDDRHAIGQMAKTDRWKLTVSGEAQVLERGLRRVWFPAQKSVAEWLGDTKLRRIGEYLITTEQQDEIDRHLRPGDILLTRKNWYLSNVGLPGFWPHAILYLGSPEKLASELDDEAVIDALNAHYGTSAATFAELAARVAPAAWFAYAAGSEEGPYLIIEAISEGVVVNDLAHASGDYLAALRPRLDAVARGQAIIEALRHVGKPYDFDFDFATEHALVCTELVWRAYRPAEGKRGLAFPVRRVAGRSTLPANEIARMFATTYGTDDAQLDFVYFIEAREREGKAVVSSLQEFLATPDRSKWDLAQR